jgi:uncharacterized protein (TIGR02246 family)
MIASRRSQVELDDARDDREAIRKLTEEWLAAVQAKDVARLLEMVTDDVIFLPASMPPIRGKAAVEAMYQSFLPQFRRVEQAVSIEEVEVAGDWAFSWGTDSLVLEPQDGGETIRRRGRGMSILRRQADGSWKFARGINNSAPEQAPQGG